MRLRNTSRQRVDVELDHATYCAVSGQCQCRSFAQARIEDHPSGFSRAEIRKGRAPRTISILALSVSDPLHEAALQCPDVLHRLGKTLKQEQE